MRIALHSRTHKTLLLGGSFLVAGLYVAFAGLDLIADHFSNTPTLASLRRAVRLQPGNAEYQYRLGRYFSLVEMSPAQAEPAMLAAVAANPHQARYWMALAEIYQLLTDGARQRAALEHALAVDPATPEVAWEAANFYIVRGDPAAALKNLRVVMTNDPYLPPNALQLCWRIHPDADFLLQEVVPPLASVDSSFLEFLLSRNETAAAARVWDKLVQLKQSVGRRYVFEYVRYLVAQQHPDQARAVWQDAAALADLAAYQPSSGNLVVNGNFSQEILNAGFDWMYLQSPDISLTLDPTQFHAGHASLHIEIDSKGIEDAGIRQLIAVSPNTSYQFSSYYKAEAMAGAGGLHFAVQDVYSGKTYFSSEDFTDADFWKLAAGSFTTDENTKLLVLRLQREPAGSPIKGRLWIDDVRLFPIRQQGGDR